MKEKEDEAKDKKEESEGKKDEENEEEEEEEEEENEENEEDKDTKKNNKKKKNSIKIKFDNIQKKNEISIEFLSYKYDEEHQYYVPLDIYQKVFNEKKELQFKINNYILAMKQKEKEIKTLQLKLKNLEKDKMNDNIILLNQEKYVNQLNKKIEKLEYNIMKFKEEFIVKETEISESKEKFEELKNNLEHYKSVFKLEFKKQMDQKKQKIILLNSELEIKNNKIENFEKKYRFLQEKYFKTLNEKKTLAQENVYKKSRLIKNPLLDKKLKLSKSKENFFGFMNTKTNNKNQLDTIRTRYKEMYGNDLVIIENNNKKNKESKESGNINLLPNINLSMSRNFEKDEELKEKNININLSNFTLKDKNNKKNDNDEIYEKNNNL